MKKLLIATVIAAAASTTAYAAPISMYYDVDVSGVTQGDNGGQMGTTGGPGTAEIILDLQDLTQNGLFTMTVANTIHNTSFVEIKGIVTNVTTGEFDVMGFLNTGEMNFIGGAATSETIACENIKTSFFGSICASNPVGTLTSFVIDQGSMVVTGPGDIVSYTQTVVTPNDIVGDVTAITNFVMTKTEVPVPAAAWLFGSALVGLAGIGRKRKAA